MEIIVKVTGTPRDSTQSLSKTDLLDTVRGVLDDEVFAASDGEPLVLTAEPMTFLVDRLRNALRRYDETNGEDVDKNMEALIEMHEVAGLIVG